jgi:hypothetical protein
VREFMQADTRGRIHNLTFEELSRVTQEDVAVRSQGDRLYIHITVKRIAGEPVDGILISREIGDSGSGPSRFVPLPATLERILDYVSEVSEYARNLEKDSGYGERR